MKNFAFLLILAGSGFCSAVTNAQPTPPGAPAVVITEIMYNPPESGADSLEFIEVRNPSSVNERSLSGYYFSEGIDFTFPTGLIIAPGAYVLIAKDSVAFEYAFGIPAYQWTNSSLLNSGETIVIMSNLNSITDSVSYGASFPWPAEPNGNGASLVLCNDTLDNNGPDNWTASTTDAGFFVNGIPVFANPGAGCLGLIGIMEEKGQGLSIFPNPNRGHFQISGAEDVLEGSCEIQLFSIAGQLVESTTVQTAAGIEVRSDAGAGTYVLRIVGDGPGRQFRLMIIQ